MLKRIMIKFILNKVIFIRKFNIFEIIFYHNYNIFIFKINSMAYDLTLLIILFMVNLYKSINKFICFTFLKS